MNIQERVPAGAEPAGRHACVQHQHRRNGGAGSPRLVNELGALEKDTGTYYLRTEYNEDASVKKLSGMLQYVIPQTTGSIHAVQSLVDQNLPRDGTSRVKQMFTSRYGARGRYIMWA